MANQKIDKLDKQILTMIAEDARVPFLEVARACNVSGAAIHQRIQKLSSAGIIKGSKFIVDPEKIGYETCAFIGLNLKNPENFDRVVEELKKIPEVVECHYTTGDFDLFIKIYALNNHHLHQGCLWCTELLRAEAPGCIEKVENTTDGDRRYDGTDDLTILLLDRCRTYEVTGLQIL